MRPMIGITTSYSDTNKKYTSHQDYANAIIHAGGIPILIPYTPLSIIPELLQSIDGLLFTGGVDIDPLLLGEEPILESGEISPIRDHFELELCRTAIRKNTPILAICRGIQVLCAATDGKIYQDILKQNGSGLKHMQQAPRSYPTHSITINTASKLYTILEKESITVNSFHHQSVKVTGKDFDVCAVSNDGIIEAIEHDKNNFCIGVQWHPESMTENDMIQSKLFESFVLSTMKDQ